MGLSRAVGRSLALAVLTAAGTIGAPLMALAAWPQFQGNGSHDGLTDGPRAPLEVEWTRTGIDLEGPNTSGGLSLPVVADDGTIVVVSPTTVQAFSASDGSDLFSAERDFGPSSQPAIAEGDDGPVVVYTEGFGDNPPTGTATPSSTPSLSPSPAGDAESFDSHVNALDLSTGKPVWSSPIQLADVVQTPVAVDDVTAYVGDVGGTVTAVDLGSGAVRWTAPLGTPIAGAVAVEGNRVLAATLGDRQTPGVLAALDAATGDELWRTDPDTIASNLLSAPVIADGRILLLEASGGIVALDLEDGRLRWRTEVVNPRTSEPFPFQGVAAPAPVSADGAVFAVDVTGRLYALDAETGVERWDQALNDPSPFSPPLLAGDQVLVTTSSGTVYAVDRETGHLVFRSATAGPFLRGLADAGESLVAVTGSEVAGLVSFGSDPNGSLIDEPSPTTFDLGTMLAGFAVGALSVGAVAVLLATPLQRRLGAALPLATDDEAG